MKPSKMTLENLYYDILLHVANEMTKEDKDKFRFWSDVHSDLPKRILENPQILDWFIELRRKGKIGPDNLVYLEDFLKHSGLEALFKDLQKYKTEREPMLRLTKKKTKEKMAKQKGTRMKSHMVEEQAHKRLGRDFISLKRKQPAGKNRDHGMAFVLFEDGINALLENSSLRESERKSLSWNIKMIAYQLFGHRVDSHRCGKCSKSQCSSGHENPSIYNSNSQCSSGHENPSIYSSNSQCSFDDGNPNIHSPNSQCSFHGNPSMDISVSSSIESQHQRTSYSMVRSALGYTVLSYTVLGFGAFTLSAALNLWLMV